MMNNWTPIENLKKSHTCSNQRLEQCVHGCTLHVWSTLVAFEAKFARMMDNDLHVKLN